MLLFSGAIYDLRQSYDDVFYVVGCLYAIDAVIFAGIVYLQQRREKYGGLYPADYDEIAGNTTQTFKIHGMHSMSKGSLANGEPGPLEGGMKPADGGIMSPDPYAPPSYPPPSYNSMNNKGDTHPLAPQFHSSQNYNSLQ